MHSDDKDTAEHTDIRDRTILAPEPDRAGSLRRRLPTDGAGCAHLADHRDIADRTARRPGPSGAGRYVGAIPLREFATHKDFAERHPRWHGPGARQGRNVSPSR